MPGTPPPQQAISPAQAPAVAVAASPAVRHRWARFWPLMVAVAVLTAAAVVAAGYWRGPQVRTTKVVRTDLARTVVASGRVVTPFRVDVGSAITGTVIAVPVAQGQRVKAGQLLIELDSTESRALVRQAELAVEQARTRIRQLREVQRPVAVQALAQARATLDNAQAQYERNRDLTARGFIGQAQLDDARKALALARAQWLSAQRQAAAEQPTGSNDVSAQIALDSAQAALDAARARLNYTRIVASSDGTLIARSVERGDTVQPGKPLLVLSPDGDTEIVVQIDERNLALLALGQPALAAADAFADRRFSARLSYINPAVDPQRGSVMIKLKVLDVPQFLRQDMTVSVDIEVEHRSAVLVVPIDVVRPSSDGRVVHVAVLEEGRVRNRPVQLGLRGAGHAEVISGLLEGQEVIGADVRLADGRRARAAPAIAAPPPTGATMRQ